jgi:hypothetical protein
MQQKEGDKGNVKKKHKALTRADTATLPVS